MGTKGLENVIHGPSTSRPQTTVLTPLRVLDLGFWQC